MTTEEIIALRKIARSTKEARLRAMELATEYVEQEFQKSLEKSIQEQVARFHKKQAERERRQKEAEPQPKADSSAVGVS